MKNYLAFKGLSLDPETKPPAMVLVQGKAGTGKSQVIEAVVTLLDNHFEYTFMPAFIVPGKAAYSCNLVIKVVNSSLIGHCDNSPPGPVNPGFTIFS